jgi:hypothetical protein
MSSILQTFLLDETPNTHGRYRLALLATSDTSFGKNFDAVCWLLPSDLPSNPELDKELAALLKTNAPQARTIRSNCLAHAKRYFLLWGFQLKLETKSVSKHPQLWGIKSPHWLDPKNSQNHHFVWMTRLLHTLILTQHYELARAFRDFLRTLANEYPEVTCKESEKWFVLIYGNDDYPS